MNRNTEQIAEQITEKLMELGAFKVGVIPVAEISFSEDFRELCRSNSCGNYGRCYTCPPDCGEIGELIEKVKQYGTAVVYQTVSPLEDSYDFEGMVEAGARHGRLNTELNRWLRQTLREGYCQLGAGGCRICERCGKLTGEPCRHPEEALISLEAHGINVSQLAASAGMKYINGPDTVTYFSAVFLP